MLVLNSNLIRNYDTIKELDLSRVEVMLNDGCVKTCNQRFEHYSMESHMNLCYDPYTMFHDNDELFVEYHKWSSVFCKRELQPDEPPPPPDLPNQVPYDFEIPIQLTDTFISPDHVWDIHDDEYQRDLKRKDKFRLS